MDSLSHFVLALAGGLLLAYGLGVRRPWVVAFAAASLLIDVDHLPPHFGIVHRLVLHNVFFVAIAGIVVGLLLGKRLGFVFALMLFGHLLFDMVEGMYGVPLLWPLSKAELLIPESWEVWFFGDPSYTIVSRTGIALAAYFGLAAAAAAQIKKPA